MNLIHLFDLSLAGRKNKSALEFGNETFTFGDIDMRSNRMANLLISEGFVAGDRKIGRASCRERVCYAV